MAKMSDMSSTGVPYDMGQREAARSRSSAGYLSEQGERAIETVREQLSSEPLAGLLMAGVVGYALGYLSGSAASRR
jgi:hypothetical protein